jgi:cytochrome c oxidase subunit 2
MIRLIAALPLLSLFGCESAPEDQLAYGQYLFDNNCAQCHQADGNGNPDIAAPGIAGLPAWYVERQLGKFKSGLRAYHEDDAAGLRMRPMARTLFEEDDIPALGAFVAQMPRTLPARTLEGDPERGRSLYGTCAACHGADGSGNESMSAPPIRQLDDWYLVTQLHNFKGGLRGGLREDTTGGQMAPMARTLADDQAVLDVVAHIQTLGR